MAALRPKGGVTFTTAETTNSGYGSEAMDVDQAEDSSHGSEG